MECEGTTGYIVPDIRKSIRRLKRVGKICYDCGIFYKYEHGFPVICPSCAKWRKYKGKKIDLPISFHPYITIEDLSPAERFKILGSYYMKKRKGPQIRYKDYAGVR